MYNKQKLFKLKKKKKKYSFRIFFLLILFCSYSFCESAFATLPPKLAFTHTPRLIPERIGGEIRRQFELEHLGLVDMLHQRFVNFGFFAMNCICILSLDDAKVPAIIAVANTIAINAKEVWCFFDTVTILFKIVSNLLDITIS